AVQVLKHLGVRSARLITNNPAKRKALETYGVPVVARLSSMTQPTPANLGYLRTKRDLLGHDVPWVKDNAAFAPDAVQEA
ncbi:MAG: bifunctional 3,4-dihydroxy-2-butanone-4-phosphate synthase/GTP cyclohydrolase II, partial [Actinophytocola sp.]|nr:bifunctional 3,4-dihydroxy-2-butanone-4-phosphate synthase/GTP cyclohydrolase II [Actinophytocola sp.]